MALQSKNVDMASVNKLENKFRQELDRFKLIADNERILKDSNMKDFVTDFNNILSVTTKKLLAKSNSQAKFNKMNKCPDSCSLNALVIWQSLFGCFIGLTLVSIVFVVSFTIVSKIQYQQYDEKSTRNS